MKLRLCMDDGGCTRCSAPLLSRDERALALCRDCDRTDDELLLDYVEHVERASCGGAGGAST